jgi:tRNA(adenine34) deaminase
MCAMAMMHARLRRVVYAAPDPKTGAAGSVVDLFSQPLLNHHTALRAGVLQAPCAQLLRDFFADRRAQARAKRLAHQAAVGSPPQTPVGADGAAPSAIVHDGPEDGP